TRVTCIGSAVPTPDWAAYENSQASIPTQCVGSAPASYVDAAPAVQLFAKGYQPSTSWRSNLSWTSGLWGRSLYVVEGIYSLNLDQPGSRDLNFAGVKRFSTADE